MGQQDLHMCSMHVTACRTTDIRVVLVQAKVALLDILEVRLGCFETSCLKVSYEAWACALFSVIDLAALPYKHGEGF